MDVWILAEIAPVFWRQKYTYTDEYGALSKTADPALLPKKVYHLL